MIHELIRIVEQAMLSQRKGQQLVLASVVDLDGSSYRKPGVRMLLAENGEMTGAVSGGCVEKEVFRQAQQVFESGKARMMTYDGRYRLGCEGLLYILLEPFQISESDYVAFREAVKKRVSVQLTSTYQKEDGLEGPFKTLIHLHKHTLLNRQTEASPSSENLLVFNQTLTPRFKLLLIGAEHDAVKLCAQAAQLGWEVEVISSWKDPKTTEDFPGAERVEAFTPEQLPVDDIDDQTAIVVMSHSFSLDLQFVLRLKDCDPAYFGVIGSSARRDRLHEQVLLYAPDTSFEFLESIYSPAGLDIGSISPEEIALSVLAEILAVVRKRSLAGSLSKKTRQKPA